MHFHFFCSQRNKIKKRGTRERKEATRERERDTSLGAFDGLVVEVERAAVVARHDQVAEGANLERRLEA